MNLPPVAELLPHEPPMVFLDALVSYGGGEIVCTARIDPSLPLVQGDHVDTLVTVEHMAQTVGAYAGAKAFSEGRPVRIGFLIGCREVQLLSPTLPVGAELRIHARCVWQSESLGNFECATWYGDEQVASATISVATPDDLEEVFR